MAYLDTIETTDPHEKDEFLWGAARIGRVIDRSRRQTYYLLELGEIRCAQKRGGTWVAPRSALKREFGSI